MRKIYNLSKETLAQRRFEASRLLEVLNDAYLASNRAPSDRAKVSFAPSGVGYGSGLCPRRWFYDFNGGVFRKDEADAVGVANMAYGTEAHERIQKLFETAGILVEAERPIDTTDSDEFPPVKGFVDLIFKWQGVDCVGEIKTTSPESFIAKASKGAGADYHVVQLLIYMKTLGLEKGCLIYENKATQELLVIPVTWNVKNRALIDNVFEWMNETRQSWEDGKKPNRAFTEKSIACKSCAYKEHCWSDDDGDIKLPRLVIDK